MKKLNLNPFPIGAESNGFIAALSSAAITCLGNDPDIKYCDRDCLDKHQEMMYHTLLTASGLAFTFDYPEDDSVDGHTMPNTPIGWRWDDSFIAELMDFIGLSYKRYRNKSTEEMREVIKDTIDCGYVALVANHGQWHDEMEWSYCWRVVFGYTNDGIYTMCHGGEILSEIQSSYEDWIVITGLTERKQSYCDILRKIYNILTDPSHDALEQVIDSELSSVTPENAVQLAYMMMGINGVPIESRWHSAEAFCASNNLLTSLIDDPVVKDKLKNLFFARYIKDNNNETHGICWKIWGELNVGPHTGYMPTEESFALIQKPEVQNELKRLYKIVFDNDRAVAAGIGDILSEVDHMKNA